MEEAASLYKKDAGSISSCLRIGRSNFIYEYCKLRCHACYQGGTPGESNPRGTAMNILCLDQYADLGGAQRMLLELLPSFTARGWNPYVAVPNERAALLEQARELGYRTGPFQFGRQSKRQKTST